MGKDYTWSVPVFLLVGLGVGNDQVVEVVGWIERLAEPILPRRQRPNANPPS
jgi:hypothetical protein